MFPYNSSSHEISTKINAFVQNSKWDVVVLEGSSLSGVGEGKEGPELNSGYCDIKFVSSTIMAASITSHPKATSANDFSTVLKSHSDKLGLTILEPTLAAKNNSIIITASETALVASAVASIIITAKNTKSKSKPLSDNIHSFSLLRKSIIMMKRKRRNPRVLNIRLLFNNDDIRSFNFNFKLILRNNLLLLFKMPTSSKTSYYAFNEPEITATLPKSESLAWAYLNLKANISLLVIKKTYFINKPNNSKSVILMLGSGPMLIGYKYYDYKDIDYNDDDYYYYFNEYNTLAKAINDGPGDEFLVLLLHTNNYKNKSNIINKINIKKLLSNVIRKTASSSITLIVSKRHEPNQQQQKQLMITMMIMIIEQKQSDYEKRVKAEPASIRASCVPFKMSRKNLFNIIKLMGMQNEATIFTVGALSLQDNNNKSNKPVKYYSFKSVIMSPNIIVKYKYDNFKEKIMFNYNDNMMSKSTPSDKSSYKSDDIVNNNFNNDNDTAVNIPTPNTCYYNNYFNYGEPTMTLTRQLNIKNQFKMIMTKDNNVPVINKNDDNIEIVNSDNKSLSNNEPYGKGLLSICRNLYVEYEKTKDFGIYEKLQQLLNVFKKTSIKETKTHPTYTDPIESYKKRWGIPSLLSGLAGGGESSLNNTGAANWASSQPTTPNNNNASNSGWGGTQGNSGGNAGPPNNWQQVTGSRSITGQNPNQNQAQGPQGGPITPGANAASGPPPSQANNSSQPNQGSGQWNTQSKTNNSVGPGSNPPPVVQNNNSNNVLQQSPQQQQGPPVANNNQINNSNTNSGSTTNTPTSNTPSTKQQLEQLNTMREALFSTDGWGYQHVNQDSNWDVPNSPEPNACKDGMWKPPVNNGTDLWEANLRNGGQPPPPQQSKTPWGHTPSSNIGGTWGEDDDTSDSSSMWTGAPTPNQPNTAQWPTGQPGNQTGMWQGGGGSGSGGGSSNWGDPRVDPRDPRELRSVDPREMRDPRDHRMSLDPREHIRVLEPMGRGAAGNGAGDPRNMSQGGGGEMRGDPRGISGRLNGAGAAEMWNQPPVAPHHQMTQGPGGAGHQQHPGAAGGPGAGPASGKMIAPNSMNQWSGPPPKDMMPGGNKPSGWEEPSPPTQRRPMPNYDDGTSLWGANNQRSMGPGKVSHWKDLPAQNIGRGGMQCPPGMLQNQMPGQSGMKPDPGPMWSHPSGPTAHNGSWADAGPPDAGSWGDTKPRNNRRYPNEMMNPGGAGKALWDEHNKQPLGHNTGNWGDTDMDPTSSWGHSQKPALTKEMIWSSREFRYLCDLGFKKEDVEVALRSREMNRDEAQELLTQLRPVQEQWRRHETHSGYDPSNQSAGGQSFPRYNHVSQQMSFPPASRTPQNPPSTQQLRMLVQQIQLAVQEGYLNHQILNQALAPQTLLLLNQLLQQIKVLQQLHQQHNVQNSLKGSSQAVLSLSVQITKTKQQISNLQNQIAVQQATYMKQQQQQQHPTTPSQPSDYYKPPVHDPISVLQNSFGELSMNKESPVNQQQSRLNQWKLPSLDKDIDGSVNEFSRAPGSSSIKPPTPGGLIQSHSSPNMNPLLGPGDGTWSSRLGDSGWPDAGNNDSTDGKDWQPGSVTGGAAFTDLVPEFEPGKPWKGTQMKTIEDDPSLTPGSVVRSPLSLAAIKDTDTIFSSGNKTSPPPQVVNDNTSIPSLSNSTWSFNPPVTNHSAFASAKNTWGDSAPPPTAVTSELWGAPMNKSGRGPPPGLGSKNAAGNTSSVTNGWTGLGGRSNTWGLQSNPSNTPNAGWISSSTWLLLRNLTPQIDGSTLKTLCMQHGPIQDFRLYLNHGIALAKYSSREEAIKAQGALNNCVLGNTTIFAESPADNDVHSLLQQLSGGAGQTPQQQPNVGVGGSWGAPRQKSNTSQVGPPSSSDAWPSGPSQLWGAAPTGNSLWSSTGLDSADQQRATPSSLNSYLPGDLLGGESM